MAESYRLEALRCGVELSASEIAERFRVALATERANELTGGSTSEANEHERWRRIVRATLPECEPAEVIFTSLWGRFAAPQQWRLYEDVEEPLRELVRLGYRFVIASNFDHRLEAICAGLPPLDRADAVFHSAGVGYAKPDPRFYQVVQQRLRVAASQCLMIGDDRINDVEAPREAGWSAIGIDRSRKATHSANWITSLEQLVDRLSEV